jgi:phosphoglycolate phosphatase-like HAD superfamily hydrolase
MIKAIFFDFDGTISDSKDIAFESLSRTLSEFGYSVDERKLVELMGVKMGRMLEALGLGGRSQVVGHREVEKIRNKFYEYFTKAAADGGVRPCVSLKPLWEMKEDVPMYIVSNSKNSYLRASIKILEIGGLFKGVYGAEKFDWKSDMLKELFGRIGIDASEAVYVGDRFSDVVAARKAGCVSVAIQNKCSWSSLEKINGENPDYVVRDFYGLRRVVRELGKRNC